MESIEKILCSAIWFDDGKHYVHSPVNIKTGMVLCGHRHHNIFAQFQVMGEAGKEMSRHEKEQGFLTNLNRFVDREEGWIIAENANQITDRIVAGKGKLYSENLY